MPSNFKVLTIQQTHGSARYNASPSKAQDLDSHCRARLPKQENMQPTWNHFKTFPPPRPAMTPTILFVQFLISRDTESLRSFVFKPVEFYQTNENQMYCQYTANQVSSFTFHSQTKYTLRSKAVGVTNTLSLILATYMSSPWRTFTKSIHESFCLGQTLSAVSSLFSTDQNNSLQQCKCSSSRDLLVELVVPRFIKITVVRKSS